jgi:glycosyltransferase involved in cell wall biosynthesis
VQVNYAYADHIKDPAVLLDAYQTLTGWSEAVAAAGATVSVVQAFHYDARISRHDIDYVFCADPEPAPRPTKTRWRWPRAFEAQVLAAKPDLVHVNSLEFAAEIWRLRRALPTGTPIVVQDHAGGVPRQCSITAPLRRRLLQGADAFLFTAREQADPWRTGRFIADRQTVYQVTESSTRLRAMDRETARSISRAEGQPALLWVGRLNAIKDPITVLDGFERALGTLPRAVLTMVFGSDDLLPVVRRRVRESTALARSVRLVGFVPHDQIAAFYSAADLFVLGSAHESCGYALIEACACGVTPVVTNIPPFRAITDNGSIGALWTHGDAADCARGLIAAANRDLNEQRRRVLAHFEQRLSWPVVGRQAVAIYEDVRTRCAAR